MKNICPGSPYSNDGSFVNTRFLTIRYLVAFAVLGALALGNFLILRAQIESNRFTNAIYAETEQQRSRLQGSTLLAQKLVAAGNANDREAVRKQLLKTLINLKTEHEKLTPSDSTYNNIPEEIREIYLAPPSRLDEEMKTYLIEANALVAAPDSELNWFNPHFLHIDRSAMSSKMADSLHRVAAIYEAQSQRRANFLRLLAFWSAGSTILVLVASGLWIFRPMARRVQQDVDSLRHYNETLRRLAEIGNTVAAVAHECRNSLQQIQACIGLLEAKTFGDAEAAALLDDMQKAQHRLHRLFEDLRGYVAPFALDVRLCDPRKVLETAWNALAPSRTKRAASLNIRSRETDLQCQADPLRLEQVFRNLLENALEACDDPLIVEAEIATADSAEGAAVEIDIRDNGPGFTPEQTQRAFEPFYTTKKNGSGLGLAIVKRIVESHRGKIVIRNGDCRGAEFKILLPKGKS